ncbi:MAG TPA: DUF4255 domain-containing protein [Bryobacteraceae bacterium]|nr:DUF4255 domain-containing protein [Bryobacteraceae bacterium]
MSDFTAIRAVSHTLKEVLRQAITESTEAQLSGVPIELRSPKELAKSTTPVVSLWLYRVTRDPDMLNRPGARPAPNQRVIQPLPIHLYYLITPISAQPGDLQVLLGRAMQALNDHASLQGADLQDSLAGSSEQLRVVFETLTLEELTRIWHSLEEPYRVSVTYEVQVVNIDSDLEPIEVSPVKVRQADYAEIV